MKTGRSAAHNASRSTADTTPHAASPIQSLRDIGYSCKTALADIIDNSITAGARSFEVQTDANAAEPTIAILDDGAITDRADVHLAKLAQPWTGFNAPAMTLTAVSDGSIAADEACSDAYRASRNCQSSDTEIVLQAALRYHEQIKAPRAA